MKRRDFLTKGAVGAFGAGLAGCSIRRPGSIKVSPEGVPFSFGDNYPKPKSGTMPMNELGTTGINVSSCGFGSHMRPYLSPYYKERERMLRDAFELGVNVFDVYDIEHSVYQYEPTGRHLAPIINDVIISIAINPYDGRSFEEELERDLRLFGRDYLDMVRIHCYSPDSDNWWQWEQLFKWKQEGKIRAVGVPIHHIKELYPLIDTYPIDYVIFPYNFFMNIAWDGHMPDEGYDSIPQILKDRGIGVITMKPFAGDFLVTPLKNVAENFKENKEVNFIHAMLKYVINSGIADTTFTGMYYPSHVYENVDAYYNPQMTGEEQKLLKKVNRVAKTKAHAWLPEHYRFFADWVPGGLKDHGLRDEKLKPAKNYFA